MDKASKVTERQKRSAECPQCGAAAGRPCKSSRIPSANSFGGGWGPYADLKAAHAARRAAYVASHERAEGDAGWLAWLALLEAREARGKAEIDYYEGEIRF